MSIEQPAMKHGAAPAWHFGGPQWAFTCVPNKNKKINSQIIGQILQSLNLDIRVCLIKVEGENTNLIELQR